MPLANTLDLVRDARSAGYAVPAINIVDDLSLRACVAAADDLGSPLIIQTSVKTVRTVGSDVLSFLAYRAADRAGVPVALHLDHCPDRRVISEAIAHGWSSVLFDASDRDLETARRETTEVVAEAHAVGVVVESEIENIVGVEDGVGGDELSHAYSAETLVEVARECGADLIAPQLGTAHGLYVAEPKLLIDRVAELQRLDEVPVVLHGGTGLAAEDVRAFIEAGVSKINVSTAVKLAYLHACRDHLESAKTSGNWEPIKMFDDVANAVRAVIATHVDVFGSANRVGQR